MLHCTVVNSVGESLAMNPSFMLSCCTSLVVLALLPFSLACEGDNGGANCDEPAPLIPRDVSCGPVQCLNGGTCGSMATDMGESSQGMSGSAMGGDMVCNCTTGYTGSNCSGINIIAMNHTLHTSVN